MASTGHDFTSFPWHQGVGVRRADKSHFPTPVNTASLAEKVQDSGSRTSWGQEQNEVCEQQPQDLALAMQAL